MCQKQKCPSNSTFIPHAQITHCASMGQVYQYMPNTNSLAPTMQLGNWPNQPKLVRINMIRYINASQAGITPNLETKNHSGYYTEAHPSQTWKEIWGGDLW